MSSIDITLAQLIRGLQELAGKYLMRDALH